MRAFLIDPGKDAAPMPGFLKLGLTRAGWTLARPDMLEAQNGREWLAQLRGGLEDADIIIGLGNFLAVFQAGDELAPMLDLMRRKIDSGCPALFDGCNTLFTHAFADFERDVRGFFDGYGIHITPTKVASTTRDYEAHGSPMCCVFQREDDTLLDARLFSDTESLSCSGSRLIQYDANVFPMIETSGLHFFVDEGDLPAVGNLGRKNAVAVRLARGKQCVIVLGGSFLGDRRETLGGIAPGLEDNLKFAENLIDELSDRARTHVDYTLSAYELFYELEARLGELIEKVFIRVSGGPDYFDQLPPRVQRNVRVDSGMLNYSKAYYSDLVTLLEQRWSDFEPYFSSAGGEPMARSAAIEPLREINELRTYIAHPAKAQQEKRKIATADVEKLKRALEMMRKVFLHLRES